MTNKLIVGNMKMNLTKKEIDFYLEKINNLENKNVVLCPSNIYIPYFLDRGFKVGIQNVFYLDKGSFTGEVSAYQANSLGIEYALVGHSERRNNFNETNKIISLKLENILQNNLTAILCVGEKKGEILEDILYTQIVEALSNLKGLENIIIAYEPVWAIGTNEIPDNDNISKAAKYIKEIVKQNFNCEVKVLYGGSINKENIKKLNEILEIDGFLIGGSCLKPEEFINIIEVAVK